MTFSQPVSFQAECVAHSRGTSAFLRRMLTRIYRFEAVA